MTKEQLIQAMALFGFQETLDYTIDQDYASIAMVAPEAQRPSEEQLQAALDTENARLAAEAAAEAEAQRKAAVQSRLLALPDLAELLSLYLEQNKEQVEEDDSFNPAGFSDVDRLESSFGWNFENLAKPTIDQLEALIATKTSRDQDKAWEQLREERNKKLSACDWTQLVNSPLDSTGKTNWASYRQTLRDLPENTQDPSNPSWPQEPGA